MGKICGIWEEHVLPRFIDVVLNTGEVHKFRSEVTSGLSGEVVEIGFGSGLNAGHYPASVKKILAVEPSAVARKLAVKHLSQTQTRVEFVGLDGQEIPLESESVDEALSTFTLCTIPDAQQALSEVRRVLKPGGKFRFLEHGLSPVNAVAKWQRRLEPIQRRIGGGCHLTRPIDTMVKEAGFEVTDLRNDQMKGPSFMRPFGYLYIGEATKV